MGEAENPVEAAEQMWFHPFVGEEVAGAAAPLKAVAVVAEMGSVCSDLR